MDHLRVIAAPEMAGRGTPSVGLDRAADYVVSECVHAGITQGVSAGVFKQPFTIGTHRLAHPAGGAAEERFGSELFEDGIFLSGVASAATRREMGQSYCRDRASRGEACPAGVEDGTVDPRPLFRTERASSSTNNVVAVIPGTGAHREEIVLLSAHLDHLGAGFPGADDNGSGSATLVAIMNSLAKSQAARPLDRSVAFVWTAGEEKGLLGSAYFVDNPPATIPLARVVQVINLDAVGALEDTRFSILLDAAPNSQTSAGLIAQANSEMDRPFTRINRDLQEFTRRQDGYSFVRKHVPTIWVFEGLTNPQGGGTLMPRYHRATDTVENLLADNGGSKIRRMSAMLTTTIEKLANASFPPPTP